MNAREFLGIERTGDSTWSMTVTERLITPGKFLFGGCGLAAGIVALEEHAERPAVWATAHYLSYAPIGSTVTVSSTLAVVGRSVTQARALATIDGKEILTINGALGTGSLSADVPWVAMPDVPPPEQCRPRRMPRGFGESVFEHIDSRVAIGRPFEDLDGTPGSPHSALWAKVPGHLEPCAATLAIFGDFVSGSTSEPLGRRTMGTSLDNTIRVATLEPTEWVLCDIHMHAMSGGFGQGIAFLFSERGTLLATASQSILARVWRDPVPDRTDPPGPR
jgi:acyl-CoA thioesterase II